MLARGAVHSSTVFKPASGGPAPPTFKAEAADAYPPPCNLFVAVDKSLSSVQDDPFHNSVLATNDVGAV